MYLPSGDQVGDHANLLSPMDILRGSFIPSWSVMYSAYDSPPLSENQAICLPSGDQSGLRSATSELRVKFLGSPFSMGTVNISPLASSRIRLPVGDSDAFEMADVTF
jgi:hypothetical protein